MEMVLEVDGVAQLADQYHPTAVGTATPPHLRVADSAWTASRGSMSSEARLSTLARRRPTGGSILHDKDAWLALEPYELEYHLDQYDEPCSYAVSFMDFLERRAGFSSDSAFSVLDLGTGAGANLMWLAKRFPRCTFTGVDVNPELIANARSRQAGSRSVSFEVIDLMDAASLGRFDWIISLQVISWIDPVLAEQSLISQMERANQGLAMTALFTHYEADYLVSVIDRRGDKKKSVNVFGIDGLGALARVHGWHVAAVDDVEMSVNLPDEGRPRDVRTITTADGRRLAFAGDVYMPWRHALLLPGTDAP